MALRHPTQWVWDFWLADTGTEWHLFFLQAPRTLHPDERHWSAGIGHAVSTDLTSWDLLGAALLRSPDPGFDDMALWTGSVVRGDDELWYLFYTGLSRAEGGTVQRIGLATSPDLHTWSRSDRPVVCSDPRWYHTCTGSGEPEAWRDPWVLRDPDGDGWHMLVTATARVGDPSQRGVVGSAWSPDLRVWEVRAPRSLPDCGFSQLEVPQAVTVEGEPMLLFSCLGPQLSRARRDAGHAGGVWALRSGALLGPYDVARATRLTDETLYVGKLVQRRDGSWALLAFVNEDADGAFGGTITDPLPVPLPPGSGPLRTMRHLS